MLAIDVMGINPDIYVWVSLIGAAIYGVAQSFTPQRPPWTISFLAALAYGALGTLFNRHGQQTLALVFTIVSVVLYVYMAIAMYRNWQATKHLK